MHRKVENIAAWITIATAFAVLLTLVFGMNYIESSQQDEQIAVIETAIKKATIQCYSLEGAYPPNVEYLIDYYGVALDRNEFTVLYVTQGANIMPQISVIKNSEARR